jgi:hypothetical protein
LKLQAALSPRKPARAIGAMLTKFEVGQKLKKDKVIEVLLISAIVLLSLNFSSAMLQSPKSPDSAHLASPFQQVLVSAQVEPNVTLLGEQTGGTNVTTITGTFRNNEDVDVYGVATATVRANQSYTEELSSNRTLLPAQGTETITITFDDLPFKAYYSCLISFAAEPIAGPSGEPETTATPSETATTTGNPSAAGGQANFASVGIAVISIAVVAVVSVTGFMMFRKTRLSEQKVRRFTSLEYQDWIMKRLRGHAGSVLDTRKGIDGFTGDNVPIMLKQSDNVGKLHVQNFMNTLTQARARSGIIVAYGFDNEAQAAATRARMNRIDIKLVTVKELIEHKETALL